MTAPNFTPGPHGVDAYSAIPPSLPASLAAPQARPIQFNELHGSIAASTTANPLVKNINPLHAVKATLQVSLGAATLTVGELLGAKEEQVVKLDRTIEQPVDLLLDGHVVARGQLVAVGNHFGVRITELPIPLDIGRAEVV